MLYISMSIRNMFLSSITHFDAHAQNIFLFYSILAWHITT